MMLLLVSFAADTGLAERMRVRRGVRGDGRRARGQLFALAAGRLQCRHAPHPVDRRTIRRYAVSAAFEPSKVELVGAGSGLHGRSPSAEVSFTSLNDVPEESGERMVRKYLNYIVFGLIVCGVVGVRSTIASTSGR